MCLRILLNNSLHPVPTRVVNFTVENGEELESFANPVWIELTIMLEVLDLERPQYSKNI